MKKFQKWIIWDRVSTLTLQRKKRYLNSLTEYLDKSLDILFDMVANSSIDEAELEKEKYVIIEEIRMYQDTPDDQVMEFNYRDSILGQYGKEIIGTEESVKSFSREAVLKYYMRDIRKTI